jgi:WD40 repeat protein
MKFQCLSSPSGLVIDARSLVYYDRLSAAMCNWFVKLRPNLLWISLYNRLLWSKRCFFTFILFSFVVWHFIILPCAPTHVISTQSDSVTEIALSSNGTFLATAEGNGSIRVWNVEKTGIKLQFGDSAHFVTDLAFSPDARSLAVFDVVFPPTVTRRPINKDETTALRVYDVNSGLLVRKIPFSRVVTSIAFSPAGNSLFTADAVEGIREWDTTSWKECRLLGEPGGGGGKTAISPTGKFLATIACSGGIVIWDLQRPCVHWEKDATPSGGYSSLAFSPDGTSLASGTGDGVVTIWEVSTGTQKDKFRVDNSVYCMSYSPDQKYLAVGWAVHPLEAAFSLGIEQGEAGLYDLSKGKARIAYKYRWHRLGVHRLVFSPDGAHLITSDAAGVVRFWPVPK